MAALIPKGLHQRKRERAVLVLGVDLSDAREEAFVCMVCDGLPLAIAFKRAGFTSRDQSAAHRLFHTPRVQERAHAIFEARKEQAAVGLPEVTSMLQRVFAGALHDAEYSAAHNAAFSLARIYGHVTDRATLEVVRRPSRDPDAPSEQALSSWVEALPGLPGPGLGALDSPSFVRLSDAPAAPLGHAPNPGPSNPNDIKGLDRSGLVDWYATTAGPEGPGPELSNDIKGLNRGTTVAGRPENGAPTGPVTGTPNSGGRSELLGPEPPGGGEKGAPLQHGQVPAIPSAEELFG